jgi:predicted AlkP superfamily pyrophosphatase or phosphodiesterase
LLFAVFPAFAQSVPRVVLISLDGLRPEFYLDESWPAPCLQDLRRRGAWARRSWSVFPSITYANHAAMVTGVSPASHGIDSNIDFSWETGPQPGWNWEARRLRVPALWDRARSAGLTTAAFSWPVSVGASVDALVPEIFHVPGANVGTTEQLIRQESTPGLLDELPAGPFPQTFAQWDEWLPGAVGHVWKTRQPDLTLIHMLNLDWTQHRFGPHSPETRASVAELDAQLRRLIEQVDTSKTTLLVVGDHGFLEYRRILAPNRLFRDKGWITAEGGRVRSWRVFARTNGGSAAIYCKDPRLVEPVRKLLERQARGRWKVLSAAELRRRRTFAGAALAITALPGNALGGAVHVPLEVATERPLGQHGHLPEWLPTGLLAVGPGIRPNTPLGDCYVLDIAPTVCRLLGIASDGMERSGLKLD